MTTAQMTQPEASQAEPAVGIRVDRTVGRPVEEHTDACAHDYPDYDDEPDDQCLHCRGDGMDPDCDYLLPCPDCGGSW